LLSELTGCSVAIGPGEVWLQQRVNKQVWHQQKWDQGLGKNKEQAKILPPWLSLGDSQDFVPIHHPYHHLEGI